MSTYENEVEINLSESGVQPLTMRELLEMKGGDVEADLAAIAATEFNYPQANGSLELRQAIAAWYPGATAANVLVTVGAIQANFTSLLTVTEPDDAVVVMQPNYQQFWGLAQNLGRRMGTFSLRQHRGWALDLDELQDAVAPDTRFVAIVNPNNPTGRVLRPEERAAIVSAAERTGAWLLADEVYAGAERVSDEITATLLRRLRQGAGRRQHLEGLRSARPADRLGRRPRRHDRPHVGLAGLHHDLHDHAGQQAGRGGPLARRAAADHRPHARLRAPRLRDRGAVGGEPRRRRGAAARGGRDLLLKYAKQINSTEFVMRLLREKDAFVAPGDLFGLDSHLRVSFGLPDDYVAEGLARIGALLDEVE